MPNYFELFRVVGGIEPIRIGGPYRAYEAALAAARKTGVESGNTDTLLSACIDDSGRIALSSFPAVELDRPVKLSAIIQK